MKKEMHLPLLEALALGEVYISDSAHLALLESGQSPAEFFALLLHGDLGSNLTPLKTQDMLDGEIYGWYATTNQMDICVTINVRKRYARIF